MSNLSVQGYTLRKRMATPDEARRTLRALAEMGLEWIQPSVPAFWTAEEFAAELKQAGLRADSFACTDVNLLARREELRRTAEALDARVIRMGALSSSQLASREELLAYAEAVEQQASVLKGDGLTLVYHFHAYEWVRVEGEYAMETLLRAAPTLKVQPDVHWLAAAGFTPQEKLRDLAGRFEYVHIQDYAMLRDEATGRIERATVPVGSGNLNLSAIVDTCRALGVTHYVIEQDDCQKDELESVADGVRALRGRLSLHPPAAAGAAHDLESH